LIWRPEELAGAGGGDADGGHSKPRLERNSADIARYW
jgi:hypothetical protein